MLSSSSSINTVRKQWRSVYQAEPGELPDDLLATAKLDCPGCGYPLTSLPARSQCPECGNPYDKQDLLTRRAGPF